MTTPSRPPGVAQSSGVGSVFFHQERERLITEIANGMESLLGNVNTLNRKLEESIAVGQEFEPIANLWGPFVDILTASGVQSAATDSAAAKGTHEQSSSRQDTTMMDEPVLSSDGAVENPLPPDVAPGGGTVYGWQ